jgi:hypothetical protein
MTLRRSLLARVLRALVACVVLAVVFAPAAMPRPTDAIAWIAQSRAERASAGDGTAKREATACSAADPWPAMLTERSPVDAAHAPAGALTHPVRTCIYLRHSSLLC